MAWVLACVFVRYMEDNGLIAETYLAGITPDRRRQAEDAQQAYLNSRPEDDTDRDYLLDVFRRVGSIPAARDLFAEGKTPLWALGPTADGARAAAGRLAEDRPRDRRPGRGRSASRGATRGSWATCTRTSPRRSARSTPCSRRPTSSSGSCWTTPSRRPSTSSAWRRSGLIDPTCGSGHLVLGSFWRLFHEWNKREPATDPTVLAQRALLERQQVSPGVVDVNPFAVAIARFRADRRRRCTLCGHTEKLKREALPGWPQCQTVVFGDSLMHGDNFDRRGFSQEWLPSSEPWADPVYAIEDPAGLQASWAASITSWSATRRTSRQGREDQRALPAAVGHLPPAVFDGGAVHRAVLQPGPRQDGEGQPAGFVGMITANSFMKREFGKKLIEEFLPDGRPDPRHRHLGSLYPRPRHADGDPVRPQPPTCRSRSPSRAGHPGRADDARRPGQGLVWQAILDQIRRRGDNRIRLNGKRWNNDLQ